MHICTFVLLYLCLSVCLHWVQSCPPAFLPACPPAVLPAWLSAWLSAWLYACLPDNLPACLPNVAAEHYNTGKLWLSVCLSLSIWMVLCLTACLPVDCLSLCMCLSVRLSVHDSSIRLQRSCWASIAPLDFGIFAIHLRFSSYYIGKVLCSAQASFKLHFFIFSTA